MATTHHNRVDSFLRGFFNFIESKHINSAILYGGKDGFNFALSDVDFVVNCQTFEQLPSLVYTYCKQTDWFLCQMLRHETTAAYFVCAAADDPVCAVALDACSDYQRNGTVYLTAKMLLENRERLKWGGHCLSLAYELRYRFAKAAAKKKDAANTASEFAKYPKEIQHDCASWLHENWKIAIRHWDTANLAPALNNLRAKSNQRPSLLQKGSLNRIISRILQPTGLIVVVGHHDFEATAAHLESVFGHLYFRRFRKARKFHPYFLKDLIASTLIIVPQLSFLASKLIPEECIHRFDPAHDSDTQCREIALHLQNRCIRRNFC